MEELVIRPYEGFGPFEFSSTVDEVRARCGLPTTEWETPRGSGYRVHWYRALGINVQFDSLGCCWVAGGEPGCVPIIGDIRLVGRFSDLVATLLGRGYRMTQHGDDDGFTFCVPLGIVLGRENPGDPEDGEQIDAVGAWRRGYWDASLGEDWQSNLHEI